LSFAGNTSRTAGASGFDDAVVVGRNSPDNGRPEIWFAADVQYVPEVDILDPITRGLRYTFGRKTDEEEACECKHNWRRSVQSGFHAPDTYLIFL
jgi:hypothetical protein